MYKTDISLYEDNMRLPLLVVAFAACLQICEAFVSGMMVQCKYSLRMDIVHIYQALVHEYLTL